MSGFFTNSEIIKSSAIKVDADQLQPDCLKCGLYKECKTPKIDIFGKGKKEILVIGEYPNSNDDEYGVPFSDDTGELLRSYLREAGISLNRDCWTINTVSCTPGEKPPKHPQIKACYPRVRKTILKLKPKVIVLLGSIAVTSLYGAHFSNRKIDRWRGYIIPDGEFKCQVFPTFSPYQLKLREKDKNLHAVFKRDIKKINVALKREYIDQKDYESFVTVLRDYKRVERLLTLIIKRKSKIMFDYEATGLKPYRTGHKIVSIGIAVSPTKAFAFPLNYKSFWTKKELKSIKRLWKKILLDPKIKKMAHSHKFEDAWSMIRAGARPKGWYWDTMMAEHILDNRSASVGLKFQTFVKFGVRPYDTMIKPFLKSKNGEFNEVEKAPFKELLVYNGLDCLYAWMLYEQQKHKFAGMKGLSRAYGFFMRGLNTMGTIQAGGINTDMAYYRQTKIDLTNRIDALKKYLTEGREASKFKEYFGRDIKITSNQDLGKLFYEVLGKDAIYTNDTNVNYKTDKATLETLNLPFVDKLLEMKKLEKAKGTYLGQFARESFKGVMHPFFDLHIPVSYRSSSSMPNFQNLPKRDPEVGNLIRKGIVPSPGCVICEADFSGAEVITSVCYHKDKNFYNYLVDPSTDMHRDNATDIWMLPSDMLVNPSYNDKQKKLAKMIRFFAKNCWTFAQFYGDWFASCGASLWEACIDGNLELPTGILLRDHLKSKGIYELGEMTQHGPTEGSFLEHCAYVEDKMWNERFPEYTQWKKDIVDFYQRHGYIETFFGFRFVGYMDSKQCCNFPIQGTSFHLLVYTLIMVDKFIRKHKLRTKLIGQIHDSILADVPTEELGFYITGVNDIVTGLQDKFKWLIVPMEIEAEISKPREEGGNFAEMKEYSIKEIQNLY